MLGGIEDYYRVASRERERRLRLGEQRQALSAVLRAERGLPRARPLFSLHRRLSAALAAFRQPELALPEPDTWCQARVPARR